MVCFTCTDFNQIISLDVSSLKWESDVFYVQKIWHGHDTDFDRIVRKYNGGLVLLADKNSKPYHIFFLEISNTGFSGYLFLYCSLI